LPEVLDANIYLYFVAINTVYCKGSQLQILITDDTIVFGCEVQISVNIILSMKFNRWQQRQYTAEGLCSLLHQSAT